MTKDEFDRAVTAFAAAERKGHVRDVLEEPELRLAYENAYRIINEAQVKGPYYALVPFFTCDGERIWLRPYWTVGRDAFAHHNAALRCYRHTAEWAVASIFQRQQAIKILHSAPGDDANTRASA
jgi:hypothetical protein